ncbi:hypothetical protein HMPREF2787_00020 [Corynebacterium sp. HMSC061H03]|nr:hypothetical protein HMPREF2820_00120 [Corynebacterium sp. HMSC064E08]OHR25981.1 hypothetical protein HMPREF2787_00020 [Corynebacterium sp. HMSC061H03]
MYCCLLYDDCSARIHGGDEMGAAASRARRKRRAWEGAGRLEKHKSASGYRMGNRLTLFKEHALGAARLYF